MPLPGALLRQVFPTLGLKLDSMIIATCRLSGSPPSTCPRLLVLVPVTFYSTISSSLTRLPWIVWEPPSSFPIQDRPYRSRLEPCPIAKVTRFLSFDAASFVQPLMDGFFPHFLSGGSGGVSFSSTLRQAPPHPSPCRFNQSPVDVRDRERRPPWFSECTPSLFAGRVVAPGRTPPERFLKEPFPHPSPGGL